MSGSDRRTPTDGSTPRTGAASQVGRILDRLLDERGLTPQMLERRTPPITSATFYTVRAGTYGLTLATLVKLGHALLLSEEELADLVWAAIDEQEDRLGLPPRWR